MRAPIFSKPKCVNCQYYINNRGREDYVKRALGRRLYPGERYCVGGTKAIKFRSSWSGNIYPGCPRREKYPLLHIYVRLERYWALERYLGIYSPYPHPYEYIYRRTARPCLTARQAFMELNKRHANVSQLLGMYPLGQEVIEIDNGLTSDFLYLQENGKWGTRGLARGCMPDERYGGMRLLAFDEVFDTTERYHHEEVLPVGCSGYVCGHFGPGSFVVVKWVEEGGGVMPDELGAIIEVLKEKGALRSQDEFVSYCNNRYWACLPDTGSNEYGFHGRGAGGEYYFRFDPREDSSYNVYVYCYPFAK